MEAQVNILKRASHVFGNSSPEALSLAQTPIFTRAWQWPPFSAVTQRPGSLGRDRPGSQSGQSSVHMRSAAAMEGAPGSLLSAIPDTAQLMGKASTILPDCPHSKKPSASLALPTSRAKLKGPHKLSLQ